MGMIPVREDSPGGGHGNPLHYSCLENSMDRGAWWAIVHRTAKIFILRGSHGEIIIDFHSPKSEVWRVAWRF